MLNAMPWLALLLGLLGNCGWWLFCFNRVNAFGFPRSLAKLGEKLCILSCFLVPALVYWLNRNEVAYWLDNNEFWPRQAGITLNMWLGWSLTSLAVLTPFWLESRRWLIPPSNLIKTEGSLFNVHQEIPGGSANNFSSKCWARVPFNEWAHIESNRKTLVLPRALPSVEGLTIGHLSDLHFTGQYRPEHYQFVIQKLMDHQPQMIVISGDIIDFQQCMPYVDSVLSRLTAPLGCYFLLGNHEKRLQHVPTLIDRLTKLGFVDLGAEDRIVSFGDSEIHLFGNESPWFDRRSTMAVTQRKLSRRDDYSDSAKRAPSEDLQVSKSGPVSEPQYFRLGVAHTPDCIGWARRNNIDLLLTGHTHGGQARFPLIGPIVAPSLYGSKFASGVFYLRPTLMHVSRGVAGTHTIRWRCPPEVSVLSLTNQKSSQ